MQYPKLLLYSLALAFWLYTQISYAQSLPQSAIRRLASRRMRYQHHLWHQIRGSWNRFSESTRDAFREIRWDPPNPFDQRRNNFAGEDFLFMHRDMIATANAAGSRIRGWSRIPAPGDGTAPVPPAYPRSAASFKSNSYYNDRMRPFETRIRDPARLREMSLNELGNTIEGQIHNALHQRWSAASSMGYRGGGQVGSSVPNIDREWDDPRYDWLVDTYSSHVNPFFYRLHGWIDDRVEDWRRANGLGSIRWRGTWTGGPVSNLGSVLKQGGNLRGKGEDSDAVGDVLEKGMEIFLKSGVPEIFFEDVVEQPPRLEKGRKVRRRICRGRRIVKA